jgi:hypothetical protein
MRSDRRLWAWILLAVVAVFFIVVAASAAFFLFLRQREAASFGWQDPVGAVAPDKIASDLAVYPLAGALEVETIDAALSNGELETAYAALVFAPDLADSQRIGRLILLGRRFGEAGDSEKAGLSYQQVFEIAILSPGLSDPARADALLGAGRGWTDLGSRSQAQGAYDQVYLIATRSPHLHMAHRRDLLVELEGAYAELGEAVQSDAARQQIIELDQGVGLQPPRQPDKSPDLPRGTNVVSSPEVGALEEGRRQAAYALLQSLEAGGEAPPAQVNALAQALQAEDTAKLTLYRQELEATAQLGRRIDIHWQIIRWLTLKSRIAMKGFGLSLVPEWESQAANIQSILSKAYEDLYFDYEDLVTGLPEASLMGPGSYQVRRQVVQAGRLGQYPNYPEQQMAEKLQSSASDLIGAGFLDELYVDVAARDGSLHFFLSSTDNYGSAGQSP